MDLIQSYTDASSDAENPNSSPDSSPIRILPSKSSAPKVDDTMLALTVAKSNLSSNKPIDPVQHIVSYNPTYEQLWAPIQGPAHPYAKDGIAQGMRNHKLGFVEDAAIASFVFDEQYNTFHKYGYAAGPSASTGNNYVGDIDALKKNDALSVYNIPQQEQKGRRLEKKRKEEVEGDDGDPAEVDNPATDAWLLKNKKSPWSGRNGCSRSLGRSRRSMRRTMLRRRLRRREVRRRMLFQIGVPFMGRRRKIIRVGHGLHRRRMLSLLMIGAIYT